MLMTVLRHRKDDSRPAKSTAKQRQVKWESFGKSPLGIAQAIGPDKSFEFRMQLHNIL